MSEFNTIPPKTLLAYEKCGTIRREFDIKEGKRVLTVGNSWSLKQILYEAFLPEGYPSSVSQDYLKYQVWDTLQALCSSISGMLSTKAVLKGVGVGEATATATSATMQWVLRDGAGMLGNIAFAWLQGSNLDCNAKTWRLVADILNDAAIFLDIIAGSSPQYFLPLICTASVSRAVVGVAGGATRAAVRQHQARRDNLGDVSAKDGSQETAVSLFGMILGMFITPLIGDSSFYTWLLFLLLTFAHLFFNYKAVTTIVMDKLNRQRADIVIQHFLSSGDVLSPVEVSKREKLFYIDTSTKVLLGESLSSLIGSDKDSKILYSLMSNNQKEKYILSVKGKQMVIVYQQDAGPSDILKSYFHAIYLKTRGNGVDSSFVYTQMNESFKIFEKQLTKKGWITSHHLLGQKEWRFEIVSKGS
eukprot:TRINITY_DN2593_c0_g1_i2.p1 TRINITY_DN2593_c0_g1~~TRINITY_DN2593_c0_g1_i2.p1  ORF type:complete len:416 (-),score=72.18 TRINITY_DN2593_c0_g1_i2:23-1270(-)